MSSNTLKRKAERSLNNASNALKQALDSAQNVDTAGLPDAFPVVAKHLHVLLDVLESAENYLRNGEETPETVEKYDLLLGLEDACRNTANHLDDIFRAVRGTDNAATKMSRYRETVADSDLGTLERAFRELLEQAADIAVEPLVGEALAEEFASAIKEVANVKLSLKKEARGQVMLVNNGDGTQLYNTGGGGQYNCSGGVQNNGPGATNHFGPDCDAKKGSA